MRLGEKTRGKKMNIESMCCATLPVPQSLCPLLLVSVWVVNINIYTLVTIRIYRTFSDLPAREMHCIPPSLFQK